MLKLLRTHSKLLIAVFGSLLMVAFLLPQALSQFNQVRPGTPVAEIGGRTLTAQQYHDAGTEFEILLNLAGPAIQSLQVEGIPHWILLRHEAERAGFVGGPLDGKNVKQQIAEQQAQMMVQRRTMFDSSATPEQLRQLYSSVVSSALAQLDQAQAKLMDKMKIDEGPVDSALAHLHGVLRLQEAYASAGTLSINETLVTAADVLDTAVADVVTIPGASVVQGESDPDGNRIMEHYLAYRDIRPGDGEFGLGYLRAPAVRFEWIGFEANYVLNLIQIDPIEVNKYWQLNKAQFPQNFADARATVEGQFKRNTLKKVTDKLVEIVKREQQRALAGVPEKDGYRELPADWDAKKPRLDELAARAQAEILRDIGVPDASPSVQSTKEFWYTKERLQGMVPLNGCSFVFNERRRVPFADFMMSVRELPSADPTLGVQTGVLAGPLVGFDGSVFFVRILDARGETPPDSIDEVREQIRKDIAMLDGYRKLVARKDEFMAKAAGGWIGMLGTEYSAMPDSGLLVTRQNITGPANIPVNPDLNVPEFRNALLDLVKDWDPKAEVSSIELAKRTIAFPIPKKLSMAFAQIQARRPPTIEQFRAASPRIAGAATRALAEGMTFDDLTFEKMKARLRWRDLSESKQTGTLADEKPGPEKPAETGAASGAAPAKPS